MAQKIPSVPETLCQELGERHYTLKPQEAEPRTETMLPAIRLPLREPPAWISSWPPITVFSTPVRAACLLTWKLFLLLGFALWTSHSQLCHPFRAKPASLHGFSLLPKLPPPKSVPIGINCHALPDTTGFASHGRPQALTLKKLKKELGQYESQQGKNL